MDEAVLLLQRSIQCASITPNEANYVSLLQSELESIGARDICLQAFEHGRNNLLAFRKGRGNFPTIMLIGHTDTVHVRDWNKRWTGDVREDPFSGAIVDGRLWGRGASDLKAGICTAISAVRLLDKAGIELRPSVMFAFVGDEESGEPGSGVSAGARHLVQEIADGKVARPEFAIYVEPTMLDIYSAHMGFMIVELKVVGKSAYFGVPELGIDALKASHNILKEIWNYDEVLKQGPAHPLVGSGFVLVTGIRGGGSIAVAGECSVDLIVKIPPGRDLSATLTELDALIREAAQKHGVSVQIQYPTRRDHPVGGTPYETQSDTREIQQLSAAIKSVRPKSGKIEAAPYWSELPFLQSIGVPGVYWAPGDISICHTPEENVSIEDYRDGILALALFLATFESGG